MLSQSNYWGGMAANEGKEKEEAALRTELTSDRLRTDETTRRKKVSVFLLPS